MKSYRESEEKLRSYNPLSPAPDFLIRLLHLMEEKTRNGILSTLVQEVCYVTLSTPNENSPKIERVEFGPGATARIAVDSAGQRVAVRACRYRSVSPVGVASLAK